jgi:hypothetical protein
MLLWVPQSHDIGLAQPGRSSLRSGRSDDARCACGLTTEPNQEHDMIDDDAPLARSKPAAQRREKKRSSSAPVLPTTPVDHLWIESAEVWVPEAWPAMHPLVGQLVSEDLSWRLAMLHWQSCRPGRLRLHDRRAWRTDGASLAAKRERLRATARELRLRATPKQKPAPWWNRNRQSRPEV